MTCVPWASRASARRAAAAQLEGSKAFAKQVMAAAEVPTAMAHVCETPEEVVAALDAFGPPYVVKDDALAAGKGVVVTEDRQEAIDHAAECGTVVIEEFLDGPEVSLFAITDGETVLPLQPAQDFKRAFDGDAGPNTGGMGAYTPLSWAPHDLVAEVSRRVLVPTVQEMARRGTPFQGLLYAGLALTQRGVKVIEFNARFGDPETQALLALLRTPLSALLHGAATGELGDVGLPQWAPESALTGRDGRRRTIPARPARAMRSPVSRPRTRSMAWTSSTPAPPSSTVVSSRPAAGSSRSRRPAPIWPRRANAPTPESR